MTSVDDAYLWCRRLATTHHENFPVASVLVPKHLRKHFTALYAFSRLGDDIADESFDEVERRSQTIPSNDHVERLQSLAFMDAAIDGQIDTSGHPVFTALHHTIATLAIPKAPFHRLIQAFRSDVVFTPPATWDDVLAYCDNSANPVGEIILHMDGSATPDAISASNDICTALQITNFLQDVEVDAAMGRVYLPWGAEESRKVAADFFVRGSRVVDAVQSWRLKQELKLIISAGYTAMKRTSYKDRQEARLGKMDYLRILLGLVTGRWRPRTRV